MTDHRMQLQYNICRKGFLWTVLLFFMVPVTAHTESDNHPGEPYPEETIADSVRTESLYPEPRQRQLHPLTWDHVDQDERIAWLLHAHRHMVSRETGIQGYRVHIYMDSGNRARLNTQRAQAEFERKYPGIKAYIVYDEPYFKLRAGDFRTRLDARRFLEKIRKDYSAAYIVVDRINFPEMD